MYKIFKHLKHFKTTCLLIDNINVCEILMRSNLNKMYISFILTNLFTYFII